MVARPRRTRGGNRKADVLVDAPSIEVNRIYPLQSFMKITGIKKDGLRTAREAGLVVRKAGARLFVCGRDFASYLDAQTHTGGTSPPELSVERKRGLR